MTEKPEQGVVLRDGIANADILNPLPDTETQEIMAKLGDLQAYLALNAHRLDKDAGRAIDIVQEARSFIITRKEKI